MPYLPRSILSLLVKVLTVVISYLSMAQCSLANKFTICHLDPTVCAVRLYSDVASAVYRGQLIHLYLEIQLPEFDTITESAIRLDIPWFGREFGFRWRLPVDQWLCQHSIPSPNALPCQLHLPIDLRSALGMVSEHFLIYIPYLGTPRPVWRLTWQLIIEKPILDLEGQILFAPVAVEISRTHRKLISNPLSLSVKDIPPPVGLQTSFVLPPGNYRVSSLSVPDLTYVGDYIDYVICIHGSGALQDIDNKLLERYLVRQLKTPLVYSGETWPDQQSRCFRWKVRLDAAGAWEIPPIEFVAYNPQMESPKYQSLQSNSVLVRCLPTRSLLAAEHSLRMPRLSCLEISQLCSPWDTKPLSPHLWFGWTLPPVIWLVLGIWRRWRGKPFIWRQHSPPAKYALKILKEQISADCPDAYIVWHAVRDYLQQKLGISILSASDRLADYLRSRGMASTFVARFIVQLNQLQEAVFSPVSRLTSADIRNIMTMLTILDSQLLNRISGRPRST